MAGCNEPDPLAEQVGARIRALREAMGLTLERLAYSCDFSKGQLSTIERGLAVPTAATLRTLAGGLGVLPLDLLTFPDYSSREKLVNLTRHLSSTEIETVLALLRHPAQQAA